MDDHGYTVTQAEVDSAVQRLRPQAVAVREAAERGDVTAQNVMRLYAMLARRVEHACLALFNAALDDWEKRRQDGKSQGPEMVST